MEGKFASVASTSWLCASITIHHEVWQTEPWGHLDPKCFFFQFVSDYFLLYVKSWNTMGFNYVQKRTGAGGDKSSYWGLCNDVENV